MMDEIAIKVKGLSKHFDKVAAVDGISFEVEKAEIFARNYLLESRIFLI